MRKTYVLSVLLLFNLCIYGQVDVLKFNKDEVMKGVVKGMEKGILTIKTSYSNNDFTLAWNEVESIVTETKFRVTLSEGEKYYGIIHSTDGKQVIIEDEELGSKTVDILDIVELSSVDEKFIDRFSASIDVALNMTKAKNLHTFTTNANAGYKTEKWNTNASFSTLHSDQDDVEEIKRWDGKITYNYILGKRWYPNAMAQWLANTEQQLDLRQNIQLGMGVYLIRSNSVYWGLKGGVNDNYERYYFYDSSEPPVKYTSDNNSWEVFIASEADLFNTGALSLYALVTSYIGITESDRWRTDAALNCKYKFPLNFYIKASVTMNYDNKPADGASESDYVLNTGFGWQW